MSNTYKKTNFITPAWEIRKLFWQLPHPSTENQLLEQAHIVYNKVLPYCCLLHENHSQVIAVCNEQGYSGISMILCCELFEKDVKRALQDFSVPFETHHNGSCSAGK